MERKRWVRRLLAPAIAMAALFSANKAWATDPDRVEWSADWPRMRAWEVADAVVLTAASTALAGIPSPSKPNFQGPILWDTPVRKLLGGRSLRVQKDAATLSDQLLTYGVLVPLIVDLYVPLGIHQNADVALEMLLIDLQSLGAAGVVSLGAERGVARARPYVSDCGPDGMVRDAHGRPLLDNCGEGGENISFFSGHAAATATMAGLTCVHHQHLPLYGGGVADLAPCVGMIGLSLTTGMARIVSDKHWSTDVVFGWSLGAFMGYVVPSMLHYGWGHGRALGEVSVSGVRIVPVPQASATSAGLGVAGSF